MREQHGRLSSEKMDGDNNNHNFHLWNGHIPESNGAIGGPIDGSDIDVSDEQFFNELKDFITNRDRTQWNINILYDIRSSVPQDIEQRARDQSSTNPVMSDLRAQLDLLNKEIEDLDKDDDGMIEHHEEEDIDSRSLEEIENVTKSLNQLKEALININDEKNALCIRLAQLGILRDSTSSNSSSSSLTTSTSTLSSTAPDTLSISRHTIVGGIGSGSDNNNINIDDTIVQSISDLNRLRQQIDLITEGVKNLPGNSSSGAQL